MRTDFFGLTGHQLVGALYSNKEYTSLDQRIQFNPLDRRLGLGPETLTKQDGSWSVYYNFDHFLYEADKNAGKGIGLFGRFGASEGDPIPAQYMYSLGPHPVPRLRSLRDRVLSRAADLSGHVHVRLRSSGLSPHPGAQL